MLDHPDDWRRALELLASSPDGCTEALLLAQCFRPALIAELVFDGLAMTETRRAYQDWPVECWDVVTTVKITDDGRAALGGSR